VLSHVPSCEADAACAWDRSIGTQPQHGLDQEGEAVVAIAEGFVGRRRAPVSAVIVAIDRNTCHARADQLALAADGLAHALGDLHHPVDARMRLALRRVPYRCWYGWKMWSLRCTATWHVCPQSAGAGSAANVPVAAS
jgi:hypothetical protein